MNYSSRNNPIRPLTIAVAATLSAMGTMAWAQSEGGGLVLEEVIVTAQKRDQSAQDIPSAINVIGGSALKDYNLQDFSDLEQLTPGLVAETKDARSGSIALRGIDYNPNSAAAQAVDVYWNDTPVAGGGGVFQQIFDLQRVEVLKGPQGTLQGRSSPAGAIIMHTAKPDMEEIEGSVSAQFSDNNGINTTAAVSLPIIPGTLSTRIAAVYDESDLDQNTNIVTGSDSSKEAKAGRISVAWLPSDSLSVDFAYQYLQSDTVDFNILMGESLQDPTLPVLSPFDRKGIQVNDTEGEATYQRASLKVAWDIGNHQINWLSGWSDVDSYVDGESLNSEGIQDLTESQRLITEDDSDFLSQELRWSNLDGEIWEYMVGVYYSEEDGSFIRHDFRIGGGPDRDRVIVTPFNSESVAVFTHNIFHLSEAWTAQIGLRWQNRKSTIESDMFAGPQGLFGLPEGEFFVSLIPEEVQDTDDDAVTGAVNLQYHFSEPDLMVYGSFATGYRSGGVTVAAVDLGDKLTFDEEDSWSTELGFKSTLLEGRATLNGAIFYQEFEDYIARAARVAVSTSGSTTGITDNADAEITGLELDFNMLITQNWQLGGGLSYVDAVFADGEDLVCNVFDANGVPVIPPGEIAASCDVGGDRLGPQPDWSGGLNSEYTMPFSSYEGYVRGLYKYNGEREDADIGVLDAYQTIDLYLGIRSESRQWDIGLFARNLFDEEEIIRATAPGLHRRQPTGYQPIDVVSQRLVGIKASYQF
jgi:iron complex outermembrane receptor protein